MAGCVAMNCGGLGATRNNLIFNDVCIFRVGDPATLKMLNSFIVSLLRGAPYCLLFNR